MKKLLFIMLAVSGICLFNSCRKKTETVIIEEKRVSGPLSDHDVEWSKEDYK